MGLKDIRDRYGVPAKQHTVVHTIDGKTGQILSASRDGFHRLWVGFIGGGRLLYHPLDLDYSVDGVMVEAKVYQRRYTQRIDAMNEALNNAD